MSRGGPRRHFTLTLDKDLAEGVGDFTASNGFTSESQAVNHLVRMSLSVTPEHGIVSADRARAFNEVRIWSMKQIADRMTEISNILRMSAEETANEDQS